MRKFISIALLASVAIPATAFAQEGEPGEGRRPRLENRAGDPAAGGRVERAAQRDADAPRFAPRADRPQRAERPAPVAVDAAAQVQVRERGDRGAWGDRGTWGGRGNWDRGQQGQPQAPIAQPAAPAAQRDLNGRRDWNRGQNDGRRDWDRNNDGRRDWDRNNNGRRDWDRNNDGRRDWDRNNDGRRDWDRNDNRRPDWNRGNDWNRGRDFRNWDRSWRNNNRYDWQRYRSSNRYAYRLPRYYAPGGWNYGYRRFSIGAYLFSGLFAQNYWIDDPWQYRLPPAYWPYQWVRYYNDALLVDTRSGYVVDSIPDIFWY